ncbi:MAG: CPBP family glutamic-type intramembrane protease [Sediminibacterium sp.]|nr:CPBP family glutamic-type intramembrane protease [Sediminibacterium sp.]
MLIINKFISRLEIINPIRLGIIFLLLEIINSYIFAFLFPDVKGSEFQNIFEELFVVVLFAPIIETYLIQHLVIINVLKYSKGNFLFALLVSAIVFGLAHTYSIIYIIKTFISGLIFGILYLTMRKNSNKAILFVTFTHSAYNLFAVTVNHLFH